MTSRLEIDLPDAAATDALGRAMAPHLRAGDCLLLSGEIGAGKSTLARAILTARLAALGRVEDIPSPSFTLVQTYDLDRVEAWHFDLYRLSDPWDAIELGLDDALDQAICLIEWPQRLGDAQPAGAMTLRLGPLGNGRRLVAETCCPDRWAALWALLEDLNERAAPP